MKKSLFIFAAAALALTACTSEDDVVQSAAQQTPAKAVAFDVYMPQVTNVTRATAGRTGAMTTTTLKESSANGGGFGVFGFYTDNAAYSASATPNFMYNQMILWNETNQGWYYDPLKYWPNETNKDSQATPAYSEEESGTPGVGTTTDYLTFFAYAPYVPKVADDGITAMTTNAASGDPLITYKADMTTLKADDQVDLLWGVAPSGDLTYTAVNGATIEKKEGLPLIDMVKPNVNTNMKFLFQHALARLGITAVAAIDQVSAGGKLDPNTKITIKSIKLTGKFGETGVLNLNNTDAGAKVANWETINGVALSSNPAIGGVTNKSFTIEGAEIAEQVRYLNPSGDYPTYKDRQTNVGVTTTKTNVIAPSTKYASTVVNPIYSPYKVYSTTAFGSAATAQYKTTADYYTYDASTKAYTKVASGTTLNAPAYGTAATPHYTVTPSVGYPSASTTVCPDLTADYYTESGGVYTYKATPTWGSGSETYYILTRTAVDIPYAYAAGTYYTADNNYYMLIPTNNFKRSSNITLDADLEDLRTITVQIDYFITTEDASLAAGRAQTHNIITKEVVFPSLDNGKSYNLNLVLGLTSVKMEAEVADWDVVNVNADLPQNTGE